MRYLLGIMMLILLSGCSDNGLLFRSSGNYPASSSGGYYKVGTPYQISGKYYYPEEVKHYSEEGLASWYEDDFSGVGLTANGESFIPHEMTAAHKTLPLPSLVRITNLENGASAIVRVNDRGPFVKNRIIDVSKRVAEVLDFHHKGTTRVEVVLLTEESQEMKRELVQEGRYSRDSNTLKSIKNTSLTSSVKEESIAPLPLKKEEAVATTPSIPKGYFVQTGAFSSAQNADSLRQELMKKFPEASVQVLEPNEGTLYKVVVGPFDGEALARQMTEKLTQEGYEAVFKNIK